MEFVVFTVTVLAPLFHVAESPFFTGLSPFVISILVLALTGSAEIISLAFFVFAVYVITPGLNFGVSSKLPIDKPESSAFGVGACPGKITWSYHALYVSTGVFSFATLFTTPLYRGEALNPFRPCLALSDFPCSLPRRLDGTQNSCKKHIFY